MTEERFRAGAKFYRLATKDNRLLLRTVYPLEEAHQPAGDLVTA